jgi:pyroglutamyl-peptidase
MPRLLVTGFGPFPGAPKNPTETLVRGLAAEPASAFGASELRAVVLPTDYRRSQAMLRRLNATFLPDIVVHFGLAAGAREIHVERQARNRTDCDKPDAAGFAPRFGRVRRAGHETLAATLPAEAIVAALKLAGFPARLSDDAGSYVCNATLYCSLAAATPGRIVGFIHVPPEGSNIDLGKLRRAALIVLRAATAAFSAKSERKSVAAAAGRLFGAFAGPEDLATNPKYMEGFGKRRDS